MRRVIFSVAGTVVLAGLVFAESGWAADDLSADVQALKAQVQAQQQEIRELRAQKGETWLNERRAEEVKALVREVLADADTRASLLQDGVMAGVSDKGKVFLQSADNAFRMEIGGFAQVRYVANFREDSEDSFGSTDDDETGFQIRRAKLQIGGHISSPKITYFLQLAGNRDSGTVELEVATAAYAFTDTLSVRAGRYKAAGLREESVVGATKQMAAERSLVNAVFTVHYVEGVELVADAADWLKLTGSINDGVRSGDPGGTGNDFQNDTTDVAFTGRADLRLAGEWAQMSDFAAWSGEDPALFVGGMFHYESAETGDSQAAAPGVNDFFIYSLDAAGECHGLGIFGAFVGRHVKVTDEASTGDLNDFGAVVQAGYMVIPDKLEPFARYEWIGPDDDRDFDDMNLITLGANYYFRKHATKLTVDVVWAFDELNLFAFSPTVGSASATSRTGLGLLPDAPGSDNQAVVRAQFQLMF